MDEETYYRAVAVLCLLKAEIIRAGKLIDAAKESTTE